MDGNEPKFGVFDAAVDVARSQRNLPHWFQPGVATFVTFRTADSMPRAVVERWLREQAQWLAARGIDADGEQLARREFVFPTAMHRDFLTLRKRHWLDALDECHGECLLRRPELGRIVADALLHFAAHRYDLDSFVVMPNHVHVLVQFRPPTELRAQLASWLRYSARQINTRLGRSGAFWQAEPFDHLVRSPEQFEYLQNYIRENPAKARLDAGDYLYWSHSS